MLTRNPLLFFCLVLTLLRLPAVAQLARFADSWVLFDQVSISGPLYSNALPRMTTLEVAEDHIYFTNLDMGTQGQDTVISDTCFFDRVYQRQYRTNRYKEVTAKWDDNNQGFIIDVNIYSSPDKSQLLFTTNFHYTLSEKQLIVVREFENKSNGEKWECKGFFERRDAE